MNSFVLMAADSASSASMTSSLIMFAAIILIFYFLIYRPQKKRDKEAQDMRDSLQVGDEVTTIGGIIGKVVSIKEETFVLETTKEKTHIRFLKAAIRSIDVKIADLTAAPAATETPVEEPKEEEPKKKFSLFGKKK